MKSSNNVKGFKEFNENLNISDVIDNAETQSLNIPIVSGSQKLYSIDDIKKIIGYMNKNYSKTEDELAKPYEDKGIDLPNDFFDGAYNLCLKRAIESIQ